VREARRVPQGTRERPVDVLRDDWLFRWFWRRRLDGHERRDGRRPRIVRVTGWRSCLWDTAEGQRQRVEFEPWWLTWVDRPDRRPWRRWAARRRK
jgi:hypothetical protein